MKRVISAEIRTYENYKKELAQNVERIRQQSTQNGDQQWDIDRKIHTYLRGKPLEEWIEEYDAHIADLRMELTGTRISPPERKLTLIAGAVVAVFLVIIIGFLSNPVDILTGAFLGPPIDVSAEISGSFNLEVHPNGSRGTVILEAKTPEMGEMVLNDVNLSRQLEIRYGAAEAQAVNNSIAVTGYAIDPSAADFTNGTLTRTALGDQLWKCVDWVYEDQLCTGEWRPIRKLVPGESYTISFDAIDPGYMETGLAAINPDKALYLPGERVSMTIATLDESGNLVDPDVVNLTVRSPDGETVTLPLQSIARGLFGASYIPSELGTHVLFLSTSGKVNSTRSTAFNVASERPYDLIRNMPTTIDPRAGPINVSITIVSNRSSVFNIVEKIPEAFSLLDAGSGVVMNNTIRWQNITNGSTVAYTIIAPIDIPSLHNFGPLEIHDNSTFTEHRSWMLAIDPAFNGGFLLFWDGASIPTNWTCVSCNTSAPFYQRFPRGNSTYGITNGSANHTPTIALETVSAGGTIVATSGASATRSSGGHTHTITNTDASTISNLPRYRQLKVIHHVGTPDTIPQGAIAIFNTTGLPTNWTRYASQDDFFVSAGPSVTTGGANNHTHNVSYDVAASGDTAQYATNSQTSPAAATTHTHTVSDTSALADHRPPYIGVVLAQASSNVSIPDGSQGLIAMFNTTPPANWNVLSDPGGPFHGNFLFGNTTYGQTGGSSAHIHANLTSTSTGASTTGIVRTTGTDTTAADPSHTHDITVSFSSENHLPPYIDVVIAQAIDTQPPTIDVASLNVTVINQSETVLLNVSLSDASNITSVNATIRYPNGSLENLSLTNSSPTVFTVVISKTNTTGVHNITTIYAADQHGFVNTTAYDTLTFTVQASPPDVFTLLNPSNGTVSTILQPNVSWQESNDTHFSNYTIYFSQSPSFSYINHSFNTTTLTDTWMVLPQQLASDISYYWRVIAYDVFGNNRTSTDNFTYTTDSTPPTVALHLPANQSFETAQVLFNYTPTDTNLANCTLYANFTGSFVANETNDTPISGDYNYFNKTLADGTYLWGVQCVDRADTATFSANRTFGVDTTPPQVNLESPPDESTENTTNNLVFEYNVTDIMTTVSQCRLYIDGSQFGSPDNTVTEGITQNFTAFVDNGNHTWQVNCTDANGFTGASSIWNIVVNVTTESDPPVVNLNEPTQGYFVNTSVVTFNYTPNDASGIENCSLFIDVSLNQTNNTVTEGQPNFFSVSAFPEGLHNWSVSCFDNLTFAQGNSSVFNFTIDTTTPSISLTAPNDTTFWTASQVNFTYVPTDTNLANCSLYGNFSGFFSFDQQDTSPVSGTQNEFTKTLADGSYLWNVLCVDQARLQSYAPANFTVHVDANAPVFSNELATPVSPQTYQPGRTYEFNVTVSDEFLDTVLIEHNFSGTLQNYTVSGIGNFSYQYTTLAAGSYVYRWIANDSTGRVNTTTQQGYVVNRNTSTLQLLFNGSQGNISVVENTTINITGLLTNPSTGVVALYINETLSGNASSPVTNISTFSQPGVYVIRASYAGNQNYTAVNTSFNITVNDTVAPYVSLESPDEGAALGSATVNLQYNVTDDGSILNCSLYINGSLNQTNFSVIKGNMQLFTEVFPDGAYNWQVQCVDTFGNTGFSETRNFTVTETTQILVNLTLNTTSVEEGSLLGATITTKDVLDNLLNTNVTMDIISADTTLPWWNTSWNLRRPLFLNETQGRNHSDVLTQVNVSGITVQDCSEIRLIQNSSINVSETPFIVTSGDNATWCEILFRTNISANEYVNQYYVYYNNSGAPNPGYTVDTFDSYFYVATSSATDEGTPTNVANIIGQNDATSSTISVTSGGTVSESASGGDFINDTTNGVISSVLARYRYAVPTVETGSWQLQYSVNAGGSYTDSFSGSSTTTQTTSAWDNITSAYGSLSWTSLNQTRLRGRVSKTGGSATITLDLYWVQLNVTTNMSIRVNTSVLGNEEQHMERFSDATGIDGQVFFSFDSDDYTPGLYSSVALASANSFNDGSNASQFNITADNTSPSVSLVLPGDGSTEQSVVGFVYAATDSNLANCSLYTNKSGSFVIAETDTSPESGSNNSFFDSFADGLYQWNVQCYDENGNNAFAVVNASFTVDTTGPVVLLLSPGTGSFHNTLPVALSYNVTDSSSLDECRLFVNGSLNQTENTPATTNQFDVSPVDGTYSWNVTCNDTVGNVGYGTTRTFILDTTDPSAFSLLLPPNETVSDNLTPLFSWEQVTEQYFQNYTLEVSLSGTFLESLTTVYTRVNITNTSVESATLQENKQYYWRVTAADQAGNTRASNGSFQYRTDTAAPNIVLVSPPDGDNDPDGNLSLVYTPSDNQLANCTLYTNISGSWSANETIVPSNGVRNNFTLNGLPQNLTFIWNVQCIDGLGYSGFSPANRSVRIGTFNATGDNQTLPTNATANNTLPSTVSVAVSGPIDLVANGFQNVSCSANVSDNNGGDDVLGASATLHHSSVTAASPDNNSNHYTNSSCGACSQLNSTFASCTCNFSLAYYALPGTWTCTLTGADAAGDGDPNTGNGTVNQLQAVTVSPTLINYGNVSGGTPAPEQNISVINYGNVPIDVLLYAYAITPGDNLSMSCLNGANISVSEQRFSTSPGNAYVSMTPLAGNLVSAPTASLGVPVRTGASNSSTPLYMSIQSGSGVLGVCNGTVVFHAEAS